VKSEERKTCIFLLAYKVWFSNTIFCVSPLPRLEHSAKAEILSEKLQHLILEHPTVFCGRHDESHPRGDLVLYIRSLRDRAGQDVPHGVAKWVCKARPRHQGRVGT